MASCAELASIGDRASDDEPSGDDPSTGNRVDTDVSVTLAATWIMWPHRRHFIRRVLPATFSSPIWYLALQLSQTNFTNGDPSLGLD
ncbi:MAG: hypothetical protein IPG04_15550 [Polyangiaceae bacterium]|nr:hypothetical protein [Polyangiaceae bacterium]